MILLSILICTIPSRQDMFKSLLANVQEQIFCSKYKGQVEIWHDDSINITTGAKRNILLEKANGQFSVFIDDDDLVSNDYIEKIVSCIENNPEMDCIGIKGQIITNGNDIKEWEISKDFGRWFEDEKKYYRTPNHISPIRTALCLKVKFPDITIGEDSDFSKRIHPLLKTESKIDSHLYFYRYTNNQTQNTNHNIHEFPYRRAWR